MYIVEKSTNGNKWILVGSYNQESVAQEVAGMGNEQGTKYQYRYRLI